MNHHETTIRIGASQSNDTRERSIDFSALEDDYVKCPIPSMLNDDSMLMNDCSHTDTTVSTAGDSNSWGGSSCESYDHYGASASTSTTRLDREDSESSLTLDDLRQFFVEDQVGIFNPSRADERPPPKARTEYKGDSQNSFTLEDLALDFEDDDDDDNDSSEEGSLGCLLGRRRPSARRRRQSSKTKSIQPRGILKNASTNTTTTRRTSSSLTMLMMEDSDMLQLSLGCGLEDDDSDIGCWALMQQSFSAEAALDLQEALQEKRVHFSSVVVHSHPVVVGDNPSVAEGVPLMLDWKAEETTTFDSLDDYEEQQNRNQSAVRKFQPEERMFLLLNSGASLQDIQEAEATVNKTRQEREATRQSNLLGAGHRTVFWKAIQRQVEQEEEQEEEILPPPGRRKMSPPRK